MKPVDVLTSIKNVNVPLLYEYGGGGKHLSKKWEYRRSHRDIIV